VRLYELDTCGIDLRIRVATKQIFPEVHAYRSLPKVSFREHPRPSSGRPTRDCGGGHGRSAPFAATRNVCARADGWIERARFVDERLGLRATAGPGPLTAWHAIARSSASARVLQCGIAESNVGATKRMLSLA
jgi:hypothetical protein